MNKFVDVTDTAAPLEAETGSLPSPLEEAAIVTTRADRQ